MNARKNRCKCSNLAERAWVEFVLLFARIVCLILSIVITSLGLRAIVCGELTAGGLLSLFGVVFMAFARGFKKIKIKILQLIEIEVQANK